MSASKIHRTRENELAQNNKAPLSQLSRRHFLSGSAALVLAGHANGATVLPAMQRESGAECEQARSGLETVSSPFLSAKPIWPAGRDAEMNLFVGFRTICAPRSQSTTSLTIAGSSLYRVWVNNQFCGWGPARGPHGYYRVDRWDITPLLCSGRNLIAIEVVGYNINSYWTLNQRSFLQAEISTGATVLAATGDAAHPFEALILPERVQNVQRYSFQRAFSEIYNIDEQSMKWREHLDAQCDYVPCSSSSTKRLISRHVPNPAFAKRQPEQIAAEGSFRSDVRTQHIWKDRSLTGIGPLLLGYTEPELAMIPSIELQKTANIENNRLGIDYDCNESTRIASGQFRIVDFGTNLTGFIGARVKVNSRTKLYFTFDERLTKGDVDFKRLGCVNIITYILHPGAYDLETFEPYTLRFLKVMVMNGSCEIDHLYLRECACPDVWTANFQSSDERVNQIFAAGRETYRQNAVDLFTDCPSRERAGWLCDSYFTAQVAPILSGHTLVERSFLENFLLPDKFPYLPDGMLPMCYPADHYNGRFIPNWSLWFLLQLEQYLTRSGDRVLVDQLRPRVLALLDYFKRFQNEDGLLEGLHGWVFIEWSAANDYTQDVNYPSNMLYAAALAAVGRLYDRPDLTEQAEAIRRTIRRQSFNGEFFVDNAHRVNGKLLPTRNRTETCQYYAFFLGTATVEEHHDLWNTLRTSFGPQRQGTGAYPEIAPSNAFIGNVLRLELLCRAGLTEQFLHESMSYLLYMAEQTGTLWENMAATASLDHAFASQIVKALYRNVLGIYEVDISGKTVSVRFTDSPLDWCEGRMPIADGFISVRWKKASGVITYQVDVPAGYKVVIANVSSMKISAGLLAAENDRPSYL